MEDNQRTRRRRHRERTDSTTSSSVYFTASPGITSANEENSEGGYVCLCVYLYTFLYMFIHTLVYKYICTGIKLC